MSWKLKSIAAAPNLGREVFSAFSLQAETARKMRIPIKRNFKNFDLTIHLFKIDFSPQSH